MTTASPKILLLEGTTHLSEGEEYFVSSPESDSCEIIQKSKVRRFCGMPHDICGVDEKLSDKLKAGERMYRRRCLCNQPCVVGISETQRAFLGCETRRCKFFRWADSVVDPPYYHLAHSGAEWRSLSPPEFKPFPSDFSRLPEFIVQGSLGDCWFLSSVAVLCDNAERLSRVIGKTQNGEFYSFRFCHDGEWKEFLVDSSVPSSDKHKGKVAFAQPKDNVVFGPLVEKAYAQMYGSYSAISGGLISEAFFDLTSCPTECISLSPTRTDPDLLWAKLCSWKKSGFLIGCSTSVTDEEGQSQGLVSSHAYSVSDAIELFDVTVGKQTKIYDFVSGRQNNPVMREKIDKLRLVQVRNPWGRKEWTGDWGGKSEKWTRTLIEKLPWYAEKHLKGSFWIEFSDWSRMFSEVEVAKTHSHWWTLAIRLAGHDYVVPLEHLISATKPQRPLHSLRLESLENNWCYISLVHPSLRGKAASFYPDVHFILRESITGKEVGSVIGKVERIQTLELVLQANLEYQLLIFAIAPDFVLPSEWRPVIRIFSAGPVTVTPASMYSPISVPAFERIIANSIPVRKQINLTPFLIFAIHSTSCLAAFSLTQTSNSDNHDHIEITVNVTLEDENLRSVGRWRFSSYQFGSNGGSTILGIISQRCHRHFITHYDLSGYQFEINVVPTILYDAPSKRTRVNGEAPIEID